MQPIGTGLYYEKAFSKAGQAISSTVVEHIEVDWQLASWHLSTVQGRRNPWDPLDQQPTKIQAND